MESKRILSELDPKLFATEKDSNLHELLFADPVACVQKSGAMR